MDTTKIKPMGRRVLVQADNGATSTSSGLVLAEREFDSAPIMGVVVAAGKESMYQVGMTVLFRRYSIDELTINDTSGEVKVSIVEDDEIVATIDA